jgi:hypothetical protein
MQSRKSLDTKEFQASQIEDHPTTVRRMLGDVLGEDSGVRGIDFAVHADDNRRRR